ncbi:MAG: ATP-grasp domain-containing protein [Clostridia bacterium]|nr:ATP-grasp domain-containing protein [Clostridia bacterium]
MKKIAVFFGGKSLEHDVSVITGVLTLNSLNKEKYDPVPVFVDKDGVFYTGDSLFDVSFFKNKDMAKLSRVVFLQGDDRLYKLKKDKIKPLFPLAAAINCMHGENGEDGTLAGLIKTLSVPFVSPSLFCSSAMIDKGFTKTVLKGLGVPYIKGAVAETVADGVRIAEKMGFPLIFKPCTAGSSIGIEKAEKADETESAIGRAFAYCGRVLIEPFIENALEINCAAFRGKDGEIFVSECEKPISSGDFLSFADKYVSGGREFPAKIDGKLSDEIKRLTERIYLGTDAFGVIRVDYIIKNGKPFVNEVNTVPGSLSYYLFCKDAAEFSEMLTEMITGAEQKFSKESTEIKSFDSGVLDSFGSKGAKRL